MRLANGKWYHSQVPFLFPASRFCLHLVAPDFEKQSIPGWAWDGTWCVFYLNVIHVKWWASAVHPVCVCLLKIPPCLARPPHFKMSKVRVGFGSACVWQMANGTIHRCHSFFQLRGFACTSSPQTLKNSRFLAERGMGHEYFARPPLPLWQCHLVNTDSIFATSHDPHHVLAHIFEIKFHVLLF